MSFFRPSFLRSDPFFAPTLFPRPTFPSLFDFPSPVSAPLYTLYDVDVLPADDLSPTTTSSVPSSSSKKSQQVMLKEEKYPEAPTPSKASPSGSSTKADSRVSTRSARGTEVEGRKAGRTSLFSPLPSLFSGMSRMDMTIDMFSTPTAYNVHASVPGLDKKDIHITVDDRVLSIEAERREEKRLRRGGLNTTNNSNSSGNTSATTNTSSSPSNGAASTNTGSATNSSGSSAASPAANTPSSEAKYPTEESRRTGSSDTAMTDAGAEKTDVGAQPSGQMEDDGVDYHHVESFYGRVSRRVQLPEDARVDELTAKYEDGIIKVTVPRTEEQKRQGRRIEVQ